jgi:DNA-binding PadR family transcriptional regulator
MYELFMLSKLMHRPMHGYLLQSILNSAIGPFRKVSWGTLYPLIKKLEQAGYIAAVEKHDDPRGKKLYRTTKEGRKRFLALVSERGAFDADSPDSFSLKVGCFGHLESALRLAILKDYRDYLDQVLAHSAAMENRLWLESSLPEQERRFALLALEHRKTIVKAETRWIDALIGNPERFMTRGENAGPATT